MRRFSFLALGIVLVALAAPSAPTNVRAQVADNAILLQWNAAPNAATYTIYRGTSSHQETLYTQGIVSLFFKNTKVTKGTIYYYEVAAVNNGGESARSAEVRVSLSASTTTPPPITHPNASGAGPGFVTVLEILVGLLLAVGGLVLVRWRMSTNAAKAAPLPSGVPLLPQDQVDPFADAWADRASDNVPPPVDLPSHAQAGGGLVARFSAPQPPEVFAEHDTSELDLIAPMQTQPTGVLPPHEQPWADSQPLDGNNATLYYADDITRSQFPNGAGPTTPSPYGNNPPVWPLAYPLAPRGSTPDTTRSLLLVAAGICAILGVLALGLFIFFNLASGGSTATSSPQPIIGNTSPSATPTLAQPSPSPSPTVVTGPVVAIASGSSQAIGNYSADMDVQGGTTDTQPNPVDISGVTDPAPASAYQNERYGNFTYTITGMTPNAAYKVRLHFAEIDFQHKHERQFNVSINGAQVLTDFDIVAEAGGPNKAIVREFMATADGNGTITIDFANGSVNNAKSSAIEILPA